MGKRRLSKKGASLLEVMMATAILGIMTVAGGMHFVHAAKVRMQARGRLAATIQANSLMERAFSVSDKNMYDLGNGFYHPGDDMNHYSTDPGYTWKFDGEDLPASVAVLQAPGGEQAVNITVEVEFFNGLRPVTLTAYRYCK